MKRSIINFLAVSILLFGATSVFAQSASTSDTGNVTATVSDVCTISNFALAFGSYDPTSATDDDDASATIEVFCTKDVNPTLDLSAGRTMTGPDVLTYEVYTDSTRNTLWADGFDLGTSTDPTVALTAALFGRIPANQAVAAGSYAGTLTATVNW